MRQYNPSEINLTIDKFKPFENEKYVGIKIEWSSDIGFGEYLIYKDLESNRWRADSEATDKGEDKDFIRELMKLFIDQLEIKY